MQWDYANSYGELPEADAMKVEALVKIAEQLERIADALEAQKEDKVWEVKS